MFNERNNTRISGASWPERQFLTWGRKTAVSIIGGTVVLSGLVMLFIPGPGLLVIPAGLSILGLEFLWARSFLKRMKHEGSRAYAAVRPSRQTPGLKQADSGEKRCD